ncbi:thioredoxin-like domain-containing protein [Rurimicrobium arvi]
MKKTMPTIASMLFILVFFLSHHFLTNGWLNHVNEGMLYYPVVARAIEYLIGALLFKRIFRPEKIYFSGLQLFLFEIAFTAGIAGFIAFMDDSAIFFPQFFPFHTLIDGCIVWAVLGKMKSNRMRVALIVSGFALSLVAERLLTYHFFHMTQSNPDHTIRKLNPLRYRFVDSGTIQIPNATKKYFVVVFSFNECLPCRQMNPLAEDLCLKFSSDKIAVVKINPLNTIAEILNEENGTACLKTLVPDDTATFNAQIRNKINGMPLLLIVDSGGRILYTHDGYVFRERDLVFSAIEKILTQ